MNADGIRGVLEDVFGRGLATEESNGWLKLRCPLAPYTHEKRGDTNPSAGISIQPQSVSVFNCFTCGVKAPLQGMLRQWSNYTGEDLDDLIAELDEEAFLGPRNLPSWDEARNQAAADDLPVLDQAIYMDLYDPAAGHPYLEQRFISDETADRLQLMVDPCDPLDGCERILFPVFGPEGDLHGFSGRDTTGEARLKVRDYSGLKKAKCLLGIHLIDPSVHKYVVLVEGLFDYANGWECGEPTVATMHSQITDDQIDLLKNLGLPVYVFSDNDKAGSKMVEDAARLARFMPALRVRYPEVWISDDSEAGGHWLKDPGELLPEEFESMRQDARMI